MVISRREVLLGAAGAAVLVATPEISSTISSATTGLTRYRLGSAQGDQQVLLYRTAVAVMRARSRPPVGDPTDPIGWIFQAMLHGIVTKPRPASMEEQARDKESALEEMFNSEQPPSDLRQLAAKTWGTCFHSSINFLPWHKIYLYYFEKIVREACGDPSFTLPYWAYNIETPPVIPKAFREPVKGTLWQNALYDPKRNPMLNDPGEALPLELGDRWKEALKETRFEPNPSAPDVERGFSRKLESQPHNLVHGLVSGIDDAGGPFGDMGDTSTAALDPIFWIHHTTIDWLWASWMAARPQLDNDWILAQPWANDEWHFVDEHGALVSWKYKDFITEVQDIPVYEQLQEVPPAPAPALALAKKNIQVTVSAQAVTALVPGGKPTTTQLTGSTKEMMLRPEPGKQSLVLKLSDVTLKRPVGIVFHIYLNLDDETKPDPNHHIGSLSFFGTHAHEGGKLIEDFVFDATDVVQGLIAKGKWDASPRVTLIPSAPFVGSPVKIGRVELLTASGLGDVP